MANRKVSVLLTYANEHPEKDQWFSSSFAFLTKHVFLEGTVRWELFQGPSLQCLLQ